MNIYYEHKTDSYRNNKRKLAYLSGDVLHVLSPCKETTSNGVIYGFDTGKNAQLINQEIIDKYWKEIPKTKFWIKEIMNIPTNY